ncbi:MAG: hypothetical protein JO314_01985 [Acidobacteria bacterium]|nr:hypothetical protein [Acidobacteriota bacterium]
MIELEPAVRSLAANDVQYVIVGGVAITLHGTGYITQDLDICYSRTRDNIARLVKALSPFKPAPRNWQEGLPFIFDESTIRGGTNFTFDTTIGAFDLLGEVKGIGTYEDALRSSETYEIYGCLIHAFTIDALITSKAAADRPKDHLVLPELIALKQALDPNEE